MIEAANILLIRDTGKCLVPYNWDDEWFKNLCNRKYEERLVIAGALIAAEIDRIKYINQKETP